MLGRFWKHSIQHGAKTILEILLGIHKFWKHSIQHGAKTQ